MTKFRIALVFLLVSSPFLCASATTYLITPDGTGDFETIQEAIDAAVGGDVIELADGTFRGDGNRDLDYLGKAITVRSQSGNAKTCVIDCEGSEETPHRGVWFISDEPNSALLSGVTIENGWTADYDFGGAVRCENGSAPTINSCIFTENRDAALWFDIGCEANLTDCLVTRNWGNWGAGVRLYGATFMISGCEFRKNAADRGAAAIHTYGSTGTIMGCRFVENSGDVGAVNIEEGGPSLVRDCLFLRNVGSPHGALRFFLSPNNSVERCGFFGNVGSVGALSSGKISRTYVRECTFADNFGSQTIRCGNMLVHLDNSIVATTRGGVGVTCPYDVVRISCCNIFGNEGGDWVGDIADQVSLNGNFSADPLFCDPEGDDFALAANSPCLPGNHPHGTDCELIGAYGEGCETVDAYGMTPSTSDRMLRVSPNPSRGLVGLSYGASLSGGYMTVFDVAGRMLRRYTIDPGGGTIMWDATTSSVRAPAAGTYFVRIDAGRFSETRRIVLVP